MKKIKLFNLDAHISVIADIEDIFTTLYADIEITKWSISGHTWVFGKNRDNVDVINAETWKYIDHQMIKDFHARYDDFLSEFDGFICCFPPVFALLFEKYDKPIFMVNATRYEMPFCWEANPEMQLYFEEHLLSMHKSGQLIAVSNNKADVEYLERATGVKSLHIPSMCRYTKASYAPVNDEFLFFSKMKLGSLEQYNMIYYKDLKRYEWRDLYSYQGIVHLPYEISTMSIFEHYSASVPLIMPTKRYLKQLLTSKKITFNGPYTRKEYRADLEDILGGNWFDFWLDRADYYDQTNMPHIHYYDHINHLPDILKNIDTQSIHIEMKEWNEERWRDSLEKWNQLIEDNLL